VEVMDNKYGSVTVEVHDGKVKYVDKKFLELLD